MTTKAKRAVIKLGDIELDVFQLPDGKYGYTYQWIAEMIERDKQILSDKKSPFYIPKLTKGLLSIGKFSQTVSVENISGTYRYLTSEQLLNVFSSLIELGYNQFTPMLVSCAVEALERRADNAFGIMRTEEERNDRLQARIDGKVARRTLTDSIRDYLERHPEVSDNYRKFIYINCSEYLNKIVLGCRSNQAKEYYDVPKHSLLRNHLTRAALRELEGTERLASRHIDNRDLEPLEAVKMASATMYTKTIGLD